MVPVVQLVRASDCGSECRRFESDQAPNFKRRFVHKSSFFVLSKIDFDRGGSCDVSPFLLIIVNSFFCYIEVI